MPLRVGRTLKEKALWRELQRGIRVGTSEEIERAEDRARRGCATVAGSLGGYSTSYRRLDRGACGRVISLQRTVEIVSEHRPGTEEEEEEGEEERCKMPTRRQKR